MFEKASRLKLRFQTQRGNVGVEDLWDLSLKELNTIAKALNKEIKSVDEENFLEAKSSGDAETQLMFDIVLSIIKTKQADNKARLEASTNAAKKQALLALLDSKEQEAMNELTADEIRAEIAALG